MKTHLKFVCMLILISLINTTFCISITDVINNLFNKQNLSKTQEVKTVNSIGIIKITEDINIESVDKIMRKIIDLSSNTYVKGILLIMDSSGGLSGSAELLSREFKALSNRKPIVTLIINRCLSGAYKIASGTNWIVSQSCSEIGSIGTYINIEKHTNTKVSDPKSGYSADTVCEKIYAGKYKVIRSPNSATLSAEERNFLQLQTDQIYKIFYTIIAKERKLSLDNLSEWADGKVFTGEQAIKLNLVDQLGGFSDAVNKLKTMMLERNLVSKSDTLSFLE